MFGMYYAQFNRGQTRGFSLAEDCWASNGWHRGVRVHRRRWRNHNPGQKTTGGSGCSRPYGLTLPTAPSPEKTPQGRAVGRDAVRIAESREVMSAGERPSDHPPKHVSKLFVEVTPERCLGRLRADGLDDDGGSAGFHVRQDGRNDLRNSPIEDRPPRGEPGGCELEIARRRDIPQRSDGL
jgi:hypothetical protein